MVYLQDGGWSAAGDSLFSVAASQDWGLACGGPLEIAVVLPAGLAVDTAGHLNGVSNIL